jgi:putative endonuclease
MHPPSPAQRRAHGLQLEALAADYLIAQGLQLLQRNFHSRSGEIDLVMQDGGILVFVEVRYRNNTRFGNPTETVNFRKQQKLRRCAAFYLLSNGLTHSIPARFDIVGITPTSDRKACAFPLQFSWLQDAFR